jgi:hypothetical protein
VIKSPQYVAVQHGTDLTTVGPLNLRADMDEKHMVELVRVFVCSLSCARVCVNEWPRGINDPQLRFNKASEFLAYHPRWTTFAQDLMRQHNEMCERLQEVRHDRGFAHSLCSQATRVLITISGSQIWDELRRAPDQRSFAAVSKKHGGAGHDFIFFKMRKEGIHVYSSVRQYLALAEDSIFVKLLFFWSKRPSKP